MPGGGGSNKPEKEIKPMAKPMKTGYPAEKPKKTKPKK